MQPSVEYVGIAHAHGFHISVRRNTADRHSKIARRNTLDRERSVIEWRRIVAWSRERHSKNIGFTIELAHAQIRHLWTVCSARRTVDDKSAGKSESGACRNGDVVQVCVRNLDLSQSVYPAHAGD